MPYVLYVARDRKDPSRYDLGSVLCLRVVDMMPGAPIDVYDCDDMPHERPSWLIGTPTLVADTGGDIYRGMQALNRLQSMSVEMVRTTATPKKKEGARQQQPPPMAAVAMHAAVPSQQQEQYDEGEGGGLESLWQSPMESSAEDEMEDTFNRKLTSDDLMRLSKGREMKNPNEMNNNGPPPPPPPAEKD